MKNVTIRDCNRCGKWYFMEYTRQWKEAIFQIVGALFVAYKDEDMREKAEKVLDHIIWLLEEKQEPMEASQSREGIKRIRSSSNPAKKDD
jgi:hypothetical protein